MDDKIKIQSELYSFGFTESEIHDCTEHIMRLSSKSIDIQTAAGLVAISLRTFNDLDCGTIVDTLINSNIQKVQEALPDIASAACVTGMSFNQTISMIEQSNDIKSLRNNILIALNQI